MMRNTNRRGFQSFADLREMLLEEPAPRAAHRVGDVRADFRVRIIGKQEKSALQQILLLRVYRGTLTDLIYVN